MIVKKFTITLLNCEVCKKHVFWGLIFHGNVNLIDIQATGGDAGGFVGNNFPNVKDDDLIKLSAVKKSAYHFGCFEKCYADHNQTVLKSQCDLGLMLTSDGSDLPQGQSSK